MSFAPFHSNRQIFRLPVPCYCCALSSQRTLPEFSSHVIRGVATLIADSTSYTTLALSLESPRIKPRQSSEAPRFSIHRKAGCCFRKVNQVRVLCLPYALPMLTVLSQGQDPRPCHREASHALHLTRIAQPSHTSTKALKHHKITPYMLPLSGPPMHSTDIPCTQQTSHALPCTLKTPFHWVTWTRSQGD